MQIFGIGMTDTGQVRDHNEDRLFVDNALQLYIVSGEMGGHRAGEVIPSARRDAR